MTDPTKALDDVDAIRAILDILSKLSVDDQRRVLGFVHDKLGVPKLATAAGTGNSTAGAEPAAGQRTDIRSFIQAKSPSNDVQFAAAVAYFYAFEAPDADRKTEITSAELQDATRKAGRARLAEPRNTLNNANRLGYLDRGANRGTFKINTVGENLVAMALPAAATSGAPAKAKKRATKSAKHK